MSKSNPKAGVSGSGKINSGQISLREMLSEAVFVGAEDILVGRCCDRAEKCRPGDIFIPRHGVSHDEHDRVDEAIQRGAVAVVAERLLPTTIPQCLVSSTNETYAQVCQALAGNPAQRMLTIGVVGTHGKTSTALFVAAMLKRLGGAVAYYTSLGASDSTGCDRTATKAPGAARLAQWMRQADLSGAPAAIIELTPAMLRNRVTAGVEFDLLVLTGMRSPQERGGPSLREYSQLLNTLAGSLKSHGMLLYNADDAQAANWAASSRLASINYGLDAAEHIRGKRLSRQGGEQQLLAIAGNSMMPLTLKIPGDHMARAALAAVATSWMFDFSVPNAIAGIETLTTIPGRMQRVAQAVDVPIYIDTGRTPDRVAVALHALRTHQLGQTTIVLDLNNVLDAKWRQRMGEVLEKSACRVVLTAADLSPETAQSLAMDVLGGLNQPGRVQVIPDRVAAICWAIETSGQGNILLAGCGAETWLTREGQTVSDELVACQALKQKAERAPLPALAIFPPSGPNGFFPIDS